MTVIAMTALDVDFFFRSIGRYFAIALLVTIATHAAMAAPAQGTSCYPKEGTDRSSNAKVELNCLKQLREIALRSGNALSIKMSDGKVKTFYSKPDACESGDATKCIVVQLVEYLKSFDVVVLEQSSYENRGYLLIDRRNGKSFGIGDRPFASPDSSLLVVVMGSEVSEPNGVEVWSKKRGEITKDWSYYVPPEKYELYKFDHWVGNDEVMLKVDKHVGSELKTFPVHLRRSERGWILANR